MTKEGSSKQIPRKVVIAAIFAAVGTGLVVGQVLVPPEPIDFAAAEKRVFSQNGEDGVLEKIFERIEPTQKFAVEFGSGDGVTFSNVRNLFVNHGWGGLLIEGDEDRVEKSAEAYADTPRVTSLHAWVWPGNIELLFEENGVPKDLDLLVIDIDSNDWYVWRAIRDFRPKVVQVEFNAAFAPPTKAVVDYHPMTYWDGSDYFGASIQSFYDLGKKKGYELVYCESQGMNLFFVDEKYFDRFGIDDNSPLKLYRPPSQNQGFGRGPGGRGEPMWDQFTLVDPKTGEKSMPFNGPLTWDNLEVNKKFVER